MFDKLKRAMGIKGKKRARSPTLDTIMMVEEFIKANSGKYKKTEVFRKLPRKVMWQTYSRIMRYLEENFKMVYDRRGYAVYIWVEKLTEEIKEKTKFTRGERNLDEIKKKVTPILERYGVTKAGIFGSFARGENDPYSDVDILVEMPKEADYSAYLDLLMALEEVLGRKVDLVEYPLLRKEIREDVLREEVLVRL